MSRSIGGSALASVLLATIASAGNYTVEFDRFTAGGVVAESASYRVEDSILILEPSADTASASYDVSNVLSLGLSGASSVSGWFFY